jgi:hypothetical protein
MLRYAEFMYNNFIEDAKANHDCPLCKRTVNNQELETLVAQVHNSTPLNCYFLLIFSFEVLVFLFFGLFNFFFVLVVFEIIFDLF